MIDQLRRCWKNIRNSSVPRYAKIVSLVSEGLALRLMRADFASQCSDAPMAAAGACRGCSECR